jgi:hypothetical protein
MVWRKRKKSHPAQPKPRSPESDAAATTSVISPVLKSLMQEGADRAKTELIATGRITPKALFVYDEESPTSGYKIVTVTLSVRSEQQKEALRKRVRDKAAAEGARAVVIVHDVKTKQLSVFGAMAETRMAASVSYVFNTEKKTVDRWEMQWRAAPSDSGT